MKINDELLKLLDQKEPETVDIKEIFFKFLRYWHWFVIAGVLGGAAAIIYNKYAPPGYVVSSLVLVKEKTGDGMNMEDLFSSFQLKSDVKIENHIGVLTSFSLNRQVVENLRWYTSWYKNMPFGDYNLYGSEPYQIIIESPEDNLTNIPVFIKNLGDGTYLVNVDGETFYHEKEITVDFEEVGKFGEKFSNKYFSFILNELQPDNEDLINEGDLYFVFNDLDLLALDHLKRLEISAVNKNADLIRMDLEGQSPAMEIAYLNELGQVYIQFGLSEKNLTSENTIEFIDIQLGAIVDTLKVAGNNFTNFRANNNVFDLEQKATLVLDKLVELDSRKSMIKMQYDYYENLNNYLGDAEKLKKMIAPSVVGITDVGLNNMLLKINELYSKKEALSYSLEAKNPGIQMIDRELEYALKSLSENLKNLLSNTQKELASVQEQIDRVNDELEDYPKTEQELINIKRSFDLNNELYTFLLQKRAEAEITKASNIPDIKILDKASASTLEKTGPRKMLNLMISLFFFLAIPFIIIVVREYFDDTVKSKEDLQKLTAIPVAGSIMHNKFQSNGSVNIPVVDHPRSVIAESMRALRTNLDYFHPSKDTLVIGIHSVIPGEGKSFVSLNLASIISMNNKKAVLIDADMRRPTLSKRLQMDEKEGLSTYLIGHHTLDQIIKKTDVENLDVILSGSIPPNPAELLGSQAFGDLITKLKKIYDVILIDNAPSNMVTDGAIVRQFTNVDLFVVRQGYSHKRLIEQIGQLTDNNKQKKTGIVLNDVNHQKYYGSYSYQYGGYYHKSYTEEYV